MPEIEPTSQEESISDINKKYNGEFVLVRVTGTSQKFPNLPITGILVAHSENEALVISKLSTQRSRKGLKERYYYFRANKAGKITS